MRKAVTYRITLIVVACFAFMGLLVGGGLHATNRHEAALRLYLSLVDTMELTGERLEDYMSQTVDGLQRSYADLVHGPEDVSVVCSDLCRYSHGFSVCFIDGQGTVLASSEEGLYGKSLKDNARFEALLEGLLERGQSLYLPDLDWSDKEESQIARQCVAGRRLDDQGTTFVVVTLEERDLTSKLDSVLANECKTLGVGLTGYILASDEDGKVLAGPADVEVGSVLEPLRAEIAHPGSKDVFEWSVFGQKAYVRLTKVCGRYLIGVLPRAEVQAAVWLTLHAMAVILVLVVIVLVFLLDRLLRRDILSGITRTNESLSRITGGDLDERVNVRTFEEFVELSDGINATVDELERLIEKEATRFDEELKVASTIQRTSLPRVFPPYPNRHDFGIHASMDEAREVGGDFYDFFLLSQTRLAFLVADVSDKGIPAAMFMMRAKTSIKGHVASGLPIDEAMARANDELCADNEAGMFVTVWLGVLDTETGLVEYVHAGHTSPILVSGGRAVPVRKRREGVMGGLPSITYTRQRFRLRPKDMLVLYSDGVTEAFDEKREQYGMRRLEKLLAHAADEIASPALDPNERCRAICAMIRDDVKAFAGQALQSDDLTLLCVEYEGWEERQ